MKIQKIIIALGLFFLTNAAFASNNPVQSTTVEPIEAEKIEQVAKAAIDKFDETVEYWVEPVPTAAGFQDKEGIAA